MKNRYSLFALSLIGWGLTTAVAQTTYKLTDMTASEFEQGGNKTFSFEQYNLATGDYTPFTVYSDSGRVNFYDYSVPERFGNVSLGEPSSKNLNDGSTDFYQDLKWSWAAEKVIGRDNRAPSFTYVSSDFQVYPNIWANAAIIFSVPEDGYYKVESSLIRQDWSSTDSLWAKFRFRYSGETNVSPDKTIGKDYPYGWNGEPYELQGATANYTVYSREPANGAFYIYAKAGDKISAEADASHFYGRTNFTDRENNWPRRAWARTKWLQLDVTKVEEANAVDAVNPYFVDAALNQKLIDVIYGYYDKLAEFEDPIGYGVGQWSEQSQTTFEKAVASILNLSDEQIKKLPALQSQIYYENFTKAYVIFLASANTVDYSLPENNILFGFPEGDTYWTPIVDKQFPKIEDEDRPSPWNFKLYSKATGLYTDFAGYGDWLYKSVITETECWHGLDNKWDFITKKGITCTNTYGTTCVGPAIIYTALSDGIYKVNSTVTRDVTKARDWYMWETFRFLEGGLTDTTAIAAGSYIFRAEYGKSGDGSAVSRQYYINLKKGDAFSIDITTADDAQNKGNATTTFNNLSVVKLSQDELSSFDEKSTDYYNAYQTADFKTFDATYAQFADSLAHLSIGNGYYEYTQTKIDNYKVVADSLLKVRNSTEAISFTQSQANILTYELETAFSKLIKNFNIRIENTATLPSGAYYIKQDGLFVTANTGTRLETGRVAASAPHLAEFIEQGVKNSQVWNVTNDDTLGIYSFTSVLSGESWDKDGKVFLDEMGLERLGNTEFSRQSYDYFWHQVAYDGKAWAIYTPINEYTLTFSSNTAVLRNFATGYRGFVFTFYPYTADFDPTTPIEEVGAEAKAQIAAITIANGIQLSSTTKTKVSIYNGTGAQVAEVTLASEPTTLNLASGFYIIKAANGETLKVLVK